MRHHLPRKPHTMLSSLLLVSLALGFANGALFQHSKSTSQYIHSNDTIEMSLSSRVADRLHGAVDSVHSLEFVLTNHWKGGHFRFE